MSDWSSGSRVLKSVLSSWYLLARGTDTPGDITVPASATWPSANLAVCLPFILPCPYNVTKVWWANGSAVAGNIDVGLYSPGGRLITSAGATAQSGTNALQVVTLGSSILMTPGAYYLAMSASSASATTFNTALTTAANGRCRGLLQVAANEPLGASVAFAAWAQTTGIPFFGIANAAVLG